MAVCEDHFSDLIDATDSPIYFATMTYAKMVGTDLAAMTQDVNAGMLVMIRALEAELDEISLEPGRSLAVSEWLESRELHLASLYGELRVEGADRLQLLGPDWMFAVGRKIASCSEAEFWLHVACMSDDAVLGNSGLDGGVIDCYLCFKLGLPLDALLMERNYVVLHDHRQAHRVDLPAWAGSVNALTSRGEFANPGIAVTAQWLRWWFRCPRTAPGSSEHGHG